MIPPRGISSVHWCFHHTRREWTDQACSEYRRWTLPCGTPLLIIKAPRPRREAA